MPQNRSQIYFLIEINMPLIELGIDSNIPAE